MMASLAMCRMRHCTTARPPAGWHGGAIHKYLAAISTVSPIYRRAAIVANQCNRYLFQQYGQTLLNPTVG